MSTHVRLDEDVHAKIEARKRDDETFSDAIDRLISDWTLATWGERFEADRAELGSHLDALETIEAADRERLEDTLSAIAERTE